MSWRWTVWLALVGGCASHRGVHPSMSSPSWGGEAEVAYYDDVSGAPAMEMERSDKRSMAPAAPPPPPPPRPPGMYAPEPPATSGAAQPQVAEAPAEQPAAARMVHYDGYARIRTPRAEELVEQVIALTEAAGGHVEARSVNRVTVRVPVAGFDAAWKQILGLGPVVGRHLGAEDVTAAFTDMDLRLQSLKATRDRLAALLAQAKEEEEKLALLQQIHRISEEIEVVEARLSALADLASLSRITVEAEAPQRLAGASQALPWGMGWIDALSAFDHSMHEVGRPVRLAEPAGFVRLDDKRYLMQAADGAVVWAGTLPNDPLGSAAFWRTAVAERIGEQLDGGVTSEVGGWSLIRFVEPGAEDPYVWYLAFRDDGKHLELLQIMYPNAEREKRYHDAVLLVLDGGAA